MTRQEKSARFKQFNLFCCGIFDKDWKLYKIEIETRSEEKAPTPGQEEDPYDELELEDTAVEATKSGTGYKFSQRRENRGQNDETKYTSIYLDQYTE